ncbi:MAG: HTH domain-containing protein, partial [Agathobacter sp.]|nr:HTH domain-containing protein [Agathobacter sp.]
MSGQERREQIRKILSQSKKPVAGTNLAKQFEVSRQVIVQDIALIRANGVDIIATHRGYVIQEGK